MSNTEAEPAELECRSAADGRVEVLPAREVPLGGPRAMRVRRTLPQRRRSLIGAWCFADHYGPEPARMEVAPHPHTGLQTVSWLFAGEIEHRDSLGSHALVRPGEVNLMTSGAGICHSEVSTANSEVLHGVQLWVALPDEHRHTARAFEHYAPAVVDLGGASARVFLGTLAGDTSPVSTFTPLLGAELVLAAGARLRLDVDPSFEHGVLLDSGRVSLAGTPLAPADLGYAGPGLPSLDLVNLTDEPARLLLLGGPPFDEPILMWWNFVARTHEEIVAYRAAWERESDQFGRVEGYEGEPQRLPAPPMPAVRIKPRAPR
ncbi:pirin family protein [Actinokineospora sp. NBRC 105648]|uniref:pirin family protein n=1 Tax=Actinokineospora sp. NBRC 105648 TaxID=3032206 RepID=UPI0024A3ED5C|nr:pirin family protein [Actinokineospora sp. NBRC 105648]GLZ43461.1 hypothetical protein Acsp05_70850 [Actinokineospora sp. NBRC 105648]